MKDIAFEDVIVNSDEVKLAIKTYYSNEEEMFVTDIYIIDKFYWDEGYDPMLNNNFDRRVFYSTVCTHRQNIKDSLIFHLKELHDKICDEVITGKYTPSIFRLP